jgi:hypothetical protein
LKDLSDKALVDSLQHVVRDERHAIVMSLEFLLEITSRDLPARLVYPSLFAFLTRYCKLSESCASKRGTALAVARRFPEILALLRDGKLHLSNLALVARHLTEETKDQWLQAACELRHRELEARVAELCLAPGPLREVVKTVAIVRPSQAVGESREGESKGGQKQRSIFETSACHQAPAAKAANGTEIGLRLSMTLGGAAKEALEEIQRQSPGKSLTEIVSEALLAHRDRTSQARKLAPRKTKPREALPAPTSGKAVMPSRSIPAAIKREVFARDGGRCTYVSPEGRRCECNTGLEFDHRVPVAFGGKSTESNLRVACKMHNLLYAKDLMGKAFVESHFTRAG